MGGIYTFAKKIVNKLYHAGVFEIITATKAQSITNTQKVNIEKGEGSYVHDSAVLITNGTGKIILKGKNVIGRHTELQPSPNGLIKIGFGTTIQDRNTLLGDIEFGRYCLTAPNVYISSGRHYFNHKPEIYIKDQDAMVLSSEKLLKEHSKKVTIEDDVWIGANAVLMSGITIGRGSVIGANSVVTGDVAPFSIMAGSPAKRIKKRLDLVPKSSLGFDNDQDLPNFYKGFFVNVQNLSEDRKSGGIASTHYFTSYMSDQGSTIQLVLKNLVPSSLILSYNNQEALISGSDFQTVSFKLNADGYHQFHVRSKALEDENEKVFLVKEIKILN